MSFDFSGFVQAFSTGLQAFLNAAGATFSAMFTAVSQVFTDPNVVALIAWVSFITIVGQLVAKAIGVNPVDTVRNMFVGVTGLVGRIFGGIL